MTSDLLFRRFSWLDLPHQPFVEHSAHMAKPMYLCLLNSEKWFQIQGSTNFTRMGTRTGLKADSFMVFQTFCFVTTDRWSSCRTVIALPIYASTSLLHLPVLSEYHPWPMCLNFSTCCSIFCSLAACTVFGLYINTSVFLVLIFIVTWSHAAEILSSACWRPC